MSYMKSRLLCFALSLAAIVTFGCKKDDDTDTTIKPSLYGATFTIVPYGAVGESFELSAAGTVYTTDGNQPEESELEYYWSVNLGEKVAGRHYTFTPTETGNYTITLVVASQSAAYYSGSNSRTISIIDPSLGASLTETGIDAGDDHINVDGVDYYYKSLAGKDWFRNNLAAPGSGLCYAGAEVTATVFGKYYTWEEASEACPEGWRLPSADEFKALADAYEGKAGALMADAWFNGSRMWAYKPEIGINNTSGFSAIPSGYVTISSQPKYTAINEYAAFWTSTSSGEDAGMAIYYYLNVNQKEVFSHQAEKKSLALSVRCVR